MNAPLSARLSAWQQGGQYMDWQGRKVFYRKSGQGPALLLMHGYPVGSYEWHAVCETLERYFTVIAPDMLGHGFSDEPLDGDYSLGAHAQMHNDLLHHLRITRCQVMACDLGVSVVQEMLAQRLEKPLLSKLDGIILLNGGMCPQAYQPRLIQRLLLTQMGSWIEPRVPKSMFAATIERMYCGHFHSPDALVDDFWALLNHGQGRAVAHRVGAFWHERKALSDRLLGALLHSNTRLRLINGSADPNSGEHMVKAFLAHAPNADVVRMPGIGHWPQIQAPDQVLIAC